MNKRMVVFVLGRLLQIMGALLVFPLIVSFIYQEPIEYVLSFLVTGVISVLIGSGLSYKHPTSKSLYAKEGFVVVSLSWLILSFFGSLPFVFSGDIPSFVDAFFETVSGFTTTGASILDDVEALSHSMLFWRSFTHLIGGMGVLVFALAVLPRSDSEQVHIMKAEVPGPTFGKLVSKLTNSARILYIIYIFLTGVTVVALILAGMPLFDSFIHAFGAAGTGGFGMLNGSIAPYDNVGVEIILGIAMLVFGANFNIYFLVFSKQFKEALQSEELKWYLGIVAASIVVITLHLTAYHHTFWDALRSSWFSVTSIITTTGFSTDNFNIWPLFPRLILILIMFVGGMAGSTGGGIKVSRIAILLKTAYSEVKRNAYPNRIVSMHFEGKPLRGKVIKAITNYLTVYIMVFVGLILIVSLEVPDFTTAFSAVAATFNNIGPGLELVGPDASYSFLSNFNKLVLSLAMIMGRLEIFPILILFAPSIWRKRA